MKISERKTNYASEHRKCRTQLENGGGKRGAVTGARAQLLGGLREEGKFLPKSF